jgi:hypothetical protein
MDILKLVVALLLTTTIIKIIVNLIYYGGLDFVGVFEDLLKKLKRTQ